VKRAPAKLFPHRERLEIWVDLEMAGKVPWRLLLAARSGRLVAKNVVSARTMYCGKGMAEQNDS